MFIRSKLAWERPFKTFLRANISFLWIIQPKSESSLAERASLTLCKLVP
jgi:hypothetical protein